MFQAYLNWSGGKDAALCLYKAQQSGLYRISSLLTSMNAAQNRISMHGVRRELLQAQATAIGLPLTTVELPEQPGMAEYEEQMRQAVRKLKGSGNTHALFGDIFLEDLRHYREEQLAKEGISCVFPLWGRDTKVLVEEFIAAGFKAIIVCVAENALDPSFCGRPIDNSFLADLPPGVDPGGERGEYHSFVYDGPIFQYPVAIRKGEIVRRTYTAPKEGDNCFTTDPVPDYGFYFQDIWPDKDS
jgi:uncharacterized protein (TIGR00290 family)